MKKLLMIILIALLLVLSYYVISDGVEIGGFEVLGIKSIKEKSGELDEKIKLAGSLTAVDFKNEEGKVIENTKKLEAQKRQYEDMTIVSSDGQIQAASQIEKYQVEKLWVQLGIHAKKNKVDIKIDVLKDATNSKDSYNLAFTVSGPYVNIQDFISDIEDDSLLGFKIEEFKMVGDTSEANSNNGFAGNPPAMKEEPISNGGLTATFACKNIFIEGIEEESQQNFDNQTMPTLQNQNANAMNTNNTANNVNTTNTVNNTNTVNSVK